MYGEEEVYDEVIDDGHHGYEEEVIVEHGGPHVVHVGGHVPYEVNAYGGGVHVVEDGYGHHDVEEVEVFGDDGGHHDEY